MMRTNGVRIIILAAAVVGGRGAAGEVIVGTGPGGAPTVATFNETPLLVDSFTPYAPTFQGGVRVAVGDVTGDGTAEIVTGAGDAGSGHVKVFDGVTGAEVRSFFAYANYSGGVFVGAGDVTKDHHADLVTGTDAGVSPHVKVFDGVTGSEVRSFFAYSPSFQGGVRVAAGDIDGDGWSDVITGAGAGAGAAGGHVKVFDGKTGSEVRSFFAYDTGFAGGVFVAGGDVNHDGKADIVTGADAGAAPHVKVFDGATGQEIRSFFAYPPSFQGGVRVAAGDVNGDGFADIVTGTGEAGAGHVKVFSGATGQEIQSFFAFGSRYAQTVYVAAAAVPEPSGWRLAVVMGVAVAWRGTKTRSASPRARS